MKGRTSSGETEAVDKLVIVGLVLLVIVVLIVWRRRRTPSRLQLVTDTKEGDRVEKVITAEQAARRALCVAAVLTRARSEVLLADVSTADAKVPAEVTKRANELAKDLNRRLADQGLWDSLSSRERAVLGKPAGSWTHQECADGTWRAEALATIAWALGLSGSIPYYDHQTEPEAVLGSLQPVISDLPLLKNVTLRPEPEIQKAREVAELWHWRARTYQIVHNRALARKHRRFDFDQIVTMTARTAEEEGLFETIDGDFPAFGKAYAKLTEDEWRMMLSIVVERHYGLNWLCGYAPGNDWDKVPTDT